MSLWLCAAATFLSATASAQDPDPAKTVEALLAEARSQDKPVRSLAIQKLGRLREKRAVPFLVELLEDPDVQVRVLSLEALAGIGDPACLPGFLERFRDSQPVVVATANREVVKFDTAAVIPSLFQAMRHRTAGVRDQASRAFERLTRFETGFDPDGPTDQREQVITRWEAWWETARSAERAGWWIAALKSDDTRMRKNAAMALRETRPREAVPALLAALGDPSEAVRLHSGIALSAITGFTFGFSPFDGPGGDASLRTQGAAAWRAWWETAKDAPESEWYLAALRDPRPENRASAAARLAGLSYEPAVLTLIGLLDDDSATVRQEAHRALIAITGVAMPYASEASSDERKAQANEMKYWWDQNRPRGRQEWLADALLNGKAPSTRASGARALGAMPSRRSVQVLLHGLADEAGGVRSAACASLQKITGRNFEYSADAPEADRRRAIDRWQDWLEGEGKNFRFD